MFIFRYSKTIQVYYQNFLEENKPLQIFYFISSYYTWDTK